MTKASREFRVAPQWLAAPRWESQLPAAMGDELGNDSGREDLERDCSVLSSLELKEYAELAVGKAGFICTRTPARVYRASRRIRM